MKHKFLLLSLILSQSLLAVPSPCDNVQGWRSALCQFAKGHFVHYAWGYEHGLRDYLLAMDLAKGEGVNADEEVLFAAGLLHDMGGFAPYEKEGVDHAVRSTQVVDEVLEKSGFPMTKAESVKKAILTHSYYDPTPPTTPEAILLHDADTLDFMGTISIVRLLPLAGREKGMKDTRDVIRLIKSFTQMANSKLYGGTYTKTRGTRRTQETHLFLQQLENESFGFAIPFLP